MQLPQEVSRNVGVAQVDFERGVFFGAQLAIDETTHECTVMIKRGGVLLSHGQRTSADRRFSTQSRNASRTR